MSIIPFPARVDGSPDASCLSALLPRYEHTLHALDRSAASVERYVGSVRRFIEWLPHHAPTLRQFTHVAGLDYRDHLGSRRLAGSTVGNNLSALVSFGDWLVERQLLLSNPMRGIARPAKRPPDPDPLTPIQVATLFEAIMEPPGLDPDAAWFWRRNRRVVYLMAFAGFRRTETCAVKWAHMLFDLDIIHLKEGTKGRKPRRVGMHPDLRGELLTVPEYARHPDQWVCGTPAGGCITRSAIEHIFERWLRKDLRIDERLGTHLHPHKLRATFATYFIWSGGSTNTLQTLLGHADINTTQHYVLSDDDQKVAEIRRLKFTRS